MALTKGTETSLFAIASVASATVSVGSAVDCSTWYSAHVKIRMGRGTGTAFTRGPSVRIEVSYLTSPTADDWTVAAEFQMALGATIASQALGGTEAVGQTVLTLAAGTNFAAGDYVFIQNTTIGDSEWVRVVSVSGADITIEEGLTKEQTAAASIARDQAEQYSAQLDLTSIQRIRIVVDGQGSGQAVICEAVAGYVTAL